MAHIPRVLVPGPLEAGDIELPAEPSRHLATVLRVRPGDPLLLFAGDGRERTANVTAVVRGHIRATVGEVVRQESPSPLVLELWCGLVRAQRFEWALEKAVEAGADVIRPLLSEFAVRGAGEKGERWQRIIGEATEQSGRLFVPALGAAASFPELLDRARGETVLVAHPGGMGWPEVAQRLPTRGCVVVAVGPEGGFSAEEMARVRAAGATVVSLGPHILRTETAAIVAVALVRTYSPATTT